MAQEVRTLTTFEFVRLLKQMDPAGNRAILISNDSEGNYIEGFGRIEKSEETFGDHDGSALIIFPFN
jgi:hypothetical protein